jgi:hypothetical protein
MKNDAGTTNGANAGVVRLTLIKGYMSDIETSILDCAIVTLVRNSLKVSFNNINDSLVVETVSDHTAWWREGCKVRLEDGEFVVECDRPQPHGTERQEVVFSVPVGDPNALDELVVAVKKCIHYDRLFQQN